MFDCLFFPTLHVLESDGSDSSTRHGAGDNAGDDILPAVKPVVEGEVVVEGEPGAIRGALRGRVEAGLFTGAAPDANRFVVAHEDALSMRIEARTSRAATYIGTNVVRLRFDPADGRTRVKFTVTFPTRAAYAVMLFGVGTLSLAAFAFLKAETIILRSYGPIPGTAILGSLALACAIGLPWLVVIRDRAVIRRAFARIIEECARSLPPAGR